MIYKPEDLITDELYLELKIRMKDNEFDFWFNCEKDDEGLLRTEADADFPKCLLRVGEHQYARVYPGTIPSMRGLYLVGGIAGNGLTITPEQFSKIQKGKLKLVVMGATKHYITGYRLVPKS